MTLEEVLRAAPTDDAADAADDDDAPGDVERGPDDAVRRRGRGAGTGTGAEVGRPTRERGGRRGRRGGRAPKTTRARRRVSTRMRSTPSSIDSPRTPTRTRRGTSSTRRTERSRTNEYRGRTRGRSPGSHSPVGSRRVSSARGWIGWRLVTTPTSFSRGTAIASTRRRRHGLWRRCGRCRGRSRNGARRCEETCDVNAALASLGSLAS